MYLKIKGESVIRTPHVRNEMEHFRHLHNSFMLTEIS